MERAADYTLLRPVWTQYLVSVRRRQPLALLDLIPGLALIDVASGSSGWS